MNIQFNDGSEIHATVHGGTHQEQLRDLARLLDEIEAGNTTEWIDTTSEYSMDDLDAILDKVSIGRI